MGAGGGGGGGGGPIVHNSTPGQDMFNGTDGVQDTFVFTLGQGPGVGTPFNMMTITGNAGSADFVSNFNPADGDKIKILDVGSSPLNNPLGSSDVAVLTNMGMTLLHVDGSNEIIFTTADTDLAQGTLSDNDFTVA